jgi:hypothetical protein
MADRMGFEPTEELPPHSLSRGAPSATRPPVHHLVYRLPLEVSRSFKGIIFFNVKKLKVFEFDVKKNFVFNEINLKTYI